MGIAGPIDIDKRSVYIPMATTEGCLVASTHRGCKAINSSGGAFTVLTNSGMTRGPVVRFPSASRGAEFKEWLEIENNYENVTTVFNGTSRFARLKSIKVQIAGRYCFIRFQATTGDAMGMNMISKGCENALDFIAKEFTDLQIISLSGNYCTDKKPAAINWIEGRGKSVVAEAIIKGNIVEKVLKTSVAALVDVNNAKNLVGSAMAGSIGTYNYDSIVSHIPNLCLPRRF